MSRLTAEKPRIVPSLSGRPMMLQPFGSWIEHWFTPSPRTRIPSWATAFSAFFEKFRALTKARTGDEDDASPTSWTYPIGASS